MIAIHKLDLPQYGVAQALQVITTAEYNSRIDAAIDSMRRRRIDFLAIYGDREHCANMAFLTGFDPRFEEAMLLLSAAGNRLLIVGNECMGYLPDAGLKIDIELFQEFSLMGQLRLDSRPLRQILTDFGISKGSSVGCIGWKYYEGNLVDDTLHAIELPCYIVDLLRDLTGERKLVRNANDILMNAQDGLRVINSADQIAQFEYAATRTSESVLAVVKHLNEGVTELELERHLQGDGLPRSCHPMISFGEKVKRGLSSPSANRAQLGDAFTIAYGLNGALTCRAGAIAHGPNDLNDDLKSFYPKFAANYFEVVVQWLEKLHTGARAGDVYDAAETARDDSLYDFAVNPGHQIHIDEWVNSPFLHGNQTVLRSGMALQLDIIPVPKGPHCYINAEDGIVLADESLQGELAAQHPEAYARMKARREFIREAIGVALDDSVLPLGNTTGWLAPYGLSPEHVFVVR